jgi:hypothetical protein
MNASALYLKVQQIDKVCLFELSWGKGQQINATLPYPEKITLLYQEWQRTYLNFYKTYLRGRVADAGIITAPTLDWHAKLVQAEAQLLYEFHNWLRSGELYEIRAVIANKNRELATTPPPIEVFLSCSPLDLARLPWEAWEINTEFAADKIHIVRAPLNIREKVTSNNPCNRQARVLAILGDDTGLNFNSEKSAIRSLEKIAEVKFIGWQPGKDIAQLKTEIVETIASKTGWDILFFAGHSNETSLTGGELYIAPNVVLSLSEIVPSLTVAKERGLQFAIFNSCSGLSIANKLIDLGLSQVAVMREPIHNRVAEEFFVLFLQALTQYKDVHESILAACEYLKLEKNLTYPSSYLIPSLFRHPEAALFRLEPFGIKQKLKNLIPSRREAIALSSLILISLQLPVQQFLLERRSLTQAIYRQVTGQIDKTATPPVLLVQIDEKSIKDAQISNPKPMDRKYLARLVDKLTAAKARVVGIDYSLDRYQGESDKILAQSLQTAIKSPNPTTFVFATTLTKTKERLDTLPNIASLNWSLQGEIDVLPGYMQLLPVVKSDSEPLFFSTVLAISQELQQLPNSPQPQLNSQSDFLQQMTYFIESNKNNKTILTSQETHVQPLTALSYWIGQMWLHPIIDFSIPPNRVYSSIPAWQLLEGEGGRGRGGGQGDKETRGISKGNSFCVYGSRSCFFPQSLEKQVVIVAPGGYGEAGVSKDDEDNFELPAAVAYWRSQENPVNQNEVFTGGEYHAYMVHHLLNKRLVVPIPDLWMIGLAILLGKTMYLLRQRKHHRFSGLILVSIITTIYGLISLQIYISSTAVLLPWFLPSAILWIYVLPSVLRRKVHE